MTHGGLGLGLVRGSGFYSGSLGFRILLGLMGSLAPPKVWPPIGSSPGFSRFHSQLQSLSLSLSLSLSWSASSLSLILSLSGLSVSLRKESKGKNGKEGEERREREKDRVSPLISLSDFLSQLHSHLWFLNFSITLTSPFSHNRPLSETRTVTGKRSARRKGKKKRNEEERKTR
jgi:hypothetical protein